MIKSFGGSKKCSIGIKVSIILLKLHQFSERISLSSDDLETAKLFFNIVKDDSFLQNFAKIFKNDSKAFEKYSGVIKIIY